MSVGLVLLAFAGGAAIVLWHWVAGTKQVSDELLKEYRRILADSRAADRATAAGESENMRPTGNSGHGGGTKAADSQRPNRA